MIDQLAVCSWSLQPRNVEELLSKLDVCGVKNVQIALSSLVDAPEEVERIHDAQKQGHIRLRSAMFQTIGEDYSTLERIKVTGGLRPDETWDQNQSDAKRCAKVARECGLDLVTFHAGFIPHDERSQFEKIADRILVIADIFESDGVKLGLETGQESAETLLELLEYLGKRSRIGVNFDPANMILYGMGDPISALQSLSMHVVQIHLKDAISTSVPGTWGEEVPAGAGEVLWEPFFQIASQLPQSVDVVIEREAGDSRIEDIRMAHELAKAHILKGES